jgi:hypothetical protein
MTFYLSVWRRGGEILLVHTQEGPILGDVTDIPEAEVFVAEIEGDYIDSAEVMATFSIVDDVPVIPGRKTEKASKSTRPPDPPEKAMARLREFRDFLLRSSDWTQAADVPPQTRAAWATYRQALRDLPQQTQNPNRPVWPPRPA